VYIAQGQWEKAAADYGAGATLDPDNHFHWYQNAALCLQTGKVDEYRRVCREMLTRFGDTGNPEIAERTAKTCSLAPQALLLAHGLESMPQQDVLKLADRAVTGTEKHGDYRWFVLAKGLTEYRAGNDAAAVYWINHFSPRVGGVHWDATAFVVMAMATHRLGLAPGADALRLAAEARMALGHAQAILAQKLPDPKEGRPFDGRDFHDWLHAQLLVHEAEGLLPRDGAGDAFLHGAALSRQGKPGEASAEYQEAIRRRPDWTEAHYNLARAFAQLGRWDQAIAAYEKFFQLSPSDATTYNDVAWSLAARPDLPVPNSKYTVHLAQKAVELVPKQAFFWNTLGVAQYRAGHWKNAIEALTKSMELQKGNLESFDTFFLAMAHWRLDEKEKGHQWYDRAVLWMEKNRDKLERNKQWLEELRRFRAEAEELLGVKDQQQRHKGTKKEPER
jgi:tetratricopeptide (TPR) repeat protein